VKVVVTPPGGGSILALRGADMRIKAGLDETGPELTVVESSDPEGFAPAPHRHHAAVEAFYVLAGRYTFTADGDIAVAEAGTFVLVPKGVTHSYVVGPGPGRILIFFAPAGVERFWRAMNDAGASGPVSREVRDRLAADLIASDFD
jgi:quercetin dioxygenase-like cupin family protein